MKAEVRSQASEAGSESSAPVTLSLNTLSKPLCVAAFSALLLLATACALQASRSGIPSPVQAVIDSVSTDIADGNYEKIYNEAAEEWRQAATPEQSGATFKTLKDRLGSVKSRSYHSATEQDTTSSHTFTITYKTTFDRAEGMETFTLVERDGRWLLARYFVNSNALTP
jgi:Protein of unknown function (DUF4019)/Protein of unknown function (DUF3887)